VGHPLAANDETKMTVAEPQRAVPKPKLRWFQFSLGTLLVVVTLCVVACSWRAVKLRRLREETRQQSEAAAVIKNHGGRVEFVPISFQPEWVTRMTGDDLRYVRAIEWNPDELTDADIEAIGCLKGLQELVLNTQELTDARLKQLRIPQDLNALVIVGAGISDTGLERLKELNALHILDINSNLEAMPFPVLPVGDSDHWMAAWTGEETKLALICLHILWEETAGSFAHRDVLIVRNRQSYWGYMGVSPKEAWKHIQAGLQAGVVDISAEDAWDWLNEIVQGFFGVEELENPSIVSFIG